MDAKRRIHALTLLSMAGGSALAAEPPAMDGVRVGDHSGYTRVVIDLKEQAAPYSVRLSDDRLSVSIITKAVGSDGALPPRKSKLIREVTWHSVTNGVVVTIGADAPISLVGDGAFEPDSTSRFHRIYVDLKAE